MQNIRYVFITEFRKSFFSQVHDKINLLDPSSKVKLVILVKGDPKAPFSIATIPMCRGGCYSIPWIAPLYPLSLPYSAEC